MARQEYYDHLREVPMFADLGSHELDAIGRAATELTFQPGEVLIREGSIARDMFVVLEGTLRVTRNGEYVADIGVGGFAGEMALLADSPRNATVSAGSVTTVLHIERRSFDNVLAEAPQIAVKMLPVVAGRVVANSDHHSH